MDEREPRFLFHDAPEALAWREREPKPHAVIRCGLGGCREKLADVFQTPRGAVAVFYRNLPDMPTQGLTPETRSQGREPGSLKHFDPESRRGLMAGSRGDAGTIVGLVEGWHDIVFPSCRRHGQRPQITRDELLNLSRGKPSS